MGGSFRAGPPSLRGLWETGGSETHPSAADADVSQHQATLLIAPSPHSISRQEPQPSKPLIICPSSLQCKPVNKNTLRSALIINTITEGIISKACPICNYLLFQIFQTLKCFRYSNIYNQIFPNSFLQNLP